MTIQDVFNSIPKNPGYVDLDNLGEQGAGIRVELVEGGGVAVHYGTKGKSFALSQRELDEVEKRYNLLKKDKPDSELDASEYTDPRWSEPPHRITSPYVARIVHWMLDPKHLTKMPGINMGALKDPDFGNIVF